MGSRFHDETGCGKFSCEKTFERQRSPIEKKETNGERSSGNDADRKLAEENRQATNSRVQAL